LIQEAMQELRSPQDQILGGLARCSLMAQIGELSCTEYTNMQGQPVWIPTRGSINASSPSASILIQRFTVSVVSASFTPKMCSCSDIVNVSFIHFLPGWD
jgi:hypothetical protein